MKILDLFSGIGGFSLAADWMGWETVAFCERDKFCQKVLAKHWPDVPIFDDIKTLNGEQYYGAVNMVVGGFPCQPWSTAGQRRGVDDDRHLWPEMLRIIKQVRPAWVVGENVAGIVNMALEQVCADLEAEGYEVQPFIIPACARDATHRRDRVWIVANAKSIGSQSNTKSISSNWCSKEGVQPKFTGVFCDSSNANANSTRSTQCVTTTGITDMETQRARQSMSDAEEARFSRETESRVCRTHDGFPTGVDRSMTDPFTVPASVDEPGKGYTNRIKALGNAIVPQVVYEIFRAIGELNEQY